jgi:hypothetical protein
VTRSSRLGFTSFSPTPPLTPLRPRIPGPRPRQGRRQRANLTHDSVFIYTYASAAYGPDFKKWIWGDLREDLNCPAAGAGAGHPSTGLRACLRRHVGPLRPGADRGLANLYTSHQCYDNNVGIKKPCGQAPEGLGPLAVYEKTNLILTGFCHSWTWRITE